MPAVVRASPASPIVRWSRRRSHLHRDRIVPSNNPSRPNRRLPLLNSLLLATTRYLHRRHIRSPQCPCHPRRSNILLQLQRPRNTRTHCLLPTPRPPHTLLHRPHYPRLRNRQSPRRVRSSHRLAEVLPTRSNGSTI